MIINVNNKEYNLTNKDLIKILVECSGAVTGYLIFKTVVDICTQTQTNPLAKVTLKVGGSILAATIGVGIGIGAGATAGELVDILVKEKNAHAI